MIIAKRSYSHYMVHEPNTWKPVTRSGAPKTATYVCPDGHDELLDNHTIDGSGAVSPSVVCKGYPAGFRAESAPAEPCSFHDHLKLEGWQPLWSKQMSHAALRYSLVG